MTELKAAHQELITIFAVVGVLTRLTPRRNSADDWTTIDSSSLSWGV